ncbi:hypothetical protein [Paenisporosarcina indica]|uniref:hypothetical protein n=1 Tax=Paenisporosarcina indica TaxID=650093 RepID=UPI000A413164|nr:hypothetical protein [Paenisporosarcina indica]
MACSNDSLKGGKPPKVLVEIGNETYETILGTYCWKDTCVDTADSIEILEGTETIKVKPGETISFVMDYEPQPSEIHLSEFRENQITVDIEAIDNHFTAPTQKGTYYYSYGVWWMKEKEENVSNGDAFYAFVLEVN